MILMLLAVLAYGIGSVSSAILICRLFHLPDPRNSGSQNPGATNVLRLGGKKLALLTLLADLLKGFVPVYLANFSGVSNLGLGIVGLAAFLGHLFPCFFEFHGGKGVATFIGAILAISTFSGSLAAITWILVALFYRYSSLASLVAAAVSLIACLFFKPGAVLPVLLMVLLLIWRHRNNLSRLKFGTENKIQF